MQDKDDQLIVLNKYGSIISDYLAELRDTSIQTDRLRFRNNIRRIGAFVAYEISKRLEYTITEVSTPLGTAKCLKLNAQPIVGSVLRAGIALHEGILDVFNSADNAFVGAAREESGTTISTKLGYVASPDLGGRTLIFGDPMLATGGSMIAALEALFKHGIPAGLHLVSVIASKQGVERVLARFPTATLWVGVVDPDLNDKSYIVPGLGDAGDLAYGHKL